jgi:hypothetical protein
MRADLVNCRARIELRHKKVFIETEEDQMEAEDVRDLTPLSGE